MKYANIGLFVLIVALLVYLDSATQEPAERLLGPGGDVRPFLSTLHSTDGKPIDVDSVRVMLVCSDTLKNLWALLGSSFLVSRAAHRTLILYDPSIAGDDPQEDDTQAVILVPDPGMLTGKKMGVHRYATFIFIAGQGIVTESYNFIVNGQILLERVGT